MRHSLPADLVETAAALARPPFIELRAAGSFIEGLPKQAMMDGAALKLLKGRPAGLGHLCKRVYRGSALLATALHSPANPLSPVRTSHMSQKPGVSLRDGLSPERCSCLTYCQCFSDWLVSSGSGGNPVEGQRWYWEGMSAQLDTYFASPGPEDTSQSITPADIKSWQRTADR